MSRRLAAHPVESMDLEQLEPYVQLLERTWRDAAAEADARAIDVRKLCGRKPLSHQVDLFVDVPGMQLEAKFWEDCADAVANELDVAESRLWMLQDEAESQA